MVQFTKLRLSGFKSFVEPTELVIQRGVTGVVGPNGCGKSNLLEGLRWAMGETSSKKLRGSEMEDVIFGGTANRPARNIAEVIINLDNTSRSAPAAFNDSDEIEITRRIERGSGSAYRINGKDVRARDVQLVFADAASGARSTALVSQGRVGALVNAKPTDRRGSCSRKRPALPGCIRAGTRRSSDCGPPRTNLERLDDVITAFEGQLQGLKRQARQATRYRNISGHIRKAEAILLHLKWQEASGALEAARTELQEHRIPGRRIRPAWSANGHAPPMAEAAESLPALREAEAEAAANAAPPHGRAREPWTPRSAASPNCSAAPSFSRLEQIAADIGARTGVVRRHPGNADQRWNEEAERAGGGATNGEDRKPSKPPSSTCRRCNARSASCEAPWTRSPNPWPNKIAADDARRTDVMRRARRSHGPRRAAEPNAKTDITEERGQTGIRVGRSRPPRAPKRKPRWPRRKSG